MKAREYIERKRARKGKPFWPRAAGDSSGFVVGGAAHGFIVSGTTADIDTPEKREAIARQVMARTAELGGRS